MRLNPSLRISVCAFVLLIISTAVVGQVAISVSFGRLRFRSMSSRFVPVKVTSGSPDTGRGMRIMTTTTGYRAHLHRETNGYRLVVRFEGSGLCEEFYVRKPQTQIDDEFMRTVYSS